jgi:hypothetical protein
MPDLCHEAEGSIRDQLPPLIGLLFVSSGSKQRNPAWTTGFHRLNNSLKYGTREMILQKEDQPK